MRPLIIVQARLGSSRLFKKVLKPILNQPMLKYTLDRLKSLQIPNHLVVATTDQALDDDIEAFCNKLGIEVFRGSELNVLERFYHCALKYKAKVLVRVTGDCPIVDTALLEHMLLFYNKNLRRYDYLSNVLERSYPKGFDLEIFSFDALEKTYLQAQKPYDMEHVTPYIYQSPQKFKLYNFKDEDDLSHINLSVDTHEDFLKVEKIIKKLHPKNPLFGLKEVKQFIKFYPHLFDESIFISHADPS